MTAHAMGQSPYFGRGSLPLAGLALDLWLAASSGPILDSNGRVSTWTNLGVGGAGPSQATEGKRPLLVGSGADAEVLFTRARSDLLSRASFPVPTSYSLVVVHRFTAPPPLPLANVVVATAGAGQGVRLAGYQASRYFQHYGTVDLQEPDLTNELEQWDAEWTGATMRTRKNGSFWYGIPWGSVGTASDTFNVGGTGAAADAYGGAIREVIYRSPCFSEAEWAIVRAYLLAKHGTALLWTPKHSVPTIWLKADAGIVLDGSDVATWEDQGLNGNDYAAADYRPSLEGSGVASEVYFDAANSERLTSPLTAKATAYTCSTVLNLLDTATGTLAVALGGGRSLLTTAGGLLFVSNETVGTAGTTYVTGLQNVDYQWTGSIIRIRVNGGTWAENGCGSLADPVYDPASIGAFYNRAVPSNSKWREHVAHNRSLATHELATLRAYMLARHGV